MFERPHRRRLERRRRGIRRVERRRGVVLLVVVAVAAWVVVLAIPERQDLPPGVAPAGGLAAALLELPPAPEPEPEAEPVEEDEPPAVPDVPYGSDGAVDPPRWRQGGARPSEVPGRDRRLERSVLRRTCTGVGCGRRIEIIAPAARAEISRGLVAAPALLALIALSREHRLQVNSLRLSHPREVQDGRGGGRESNHRFGRAFDVTAVDGVSCAQETAGRAGPRSLRSTFPGGRRGPCLRLARRAGELAGDGARRPDEVIFLWAVGPTGVALENHRGHVHLGWRRFGP